jgi:penicillin-binding protein 2
MARPQHYFDWHRIVDEQAGEPVENTRHRLGWTMALFGIAMAAIFARAVQLEVSDGENFRRLAARPLARTATLTAQRGRILARDGTVLAADRRATALAVQFRYLENPPDAEWLRRLARGRLPRAERRNSERVAAMERSLRGELVELHRRVAQLCQVPLDEWQARTRRIQQRVDNLAALVNQRRLDRYQDRLAAEPPSSDVSFGTLLAGLFAPPERLPPPPVFVVEQTAFHRVVDDVPSEVVAEITNHADQYPGVKIIEHVRRDYPLGTAAAHLVGHVGRRSGVDSKIVADAERSGTDDVVGLVGIERQCEAELCGAPGMEIQITDHRGKRLATSRQRESIAGHDVVLSIDPQLQLSAEQWLDRSVRRREREAGENAGPTHGGAIVVMDVRSGEILAAASAPRFDPNLFAAGDPRVEARLHDPRQPLFDRVTKMALPPGSVFKPLTALALVEHKVVDPSEPFHCQGYLEDPDRLRCQIFRQHGVGHGDVTLADALAQSCNVYFFHYATELGAVPLLDWAVRFGFGQPSGIDLAEEAAGQLPTPSELRQTSQTRALAVGQGAFTATPLQVVRLYAAIANGGHLITPRILREHTQGAPNAGEPANVELSAEARIGGLSEPALDAVREGLRRVVEDPGGTAYDTVRLPHLAIAGKTGTAETGGQQQDHAWFAGYVPADAPRYAFVVVLEHAGSGATAAGSVARNLVQRMQQLGYFGGKETAEKPIPPGKG